ncbi:MAG: hypothetical protein KGJ35_03675 [Patescibacteria group bacterium]|nr:hypothetical protein [Patescibacteria group bacterium]
MPNQAQNSKTELFLNKNQDKKAGAGFLMLEAVIALALFSICMLSLISISFGSRRIWQSTQEKRAVLGSLAPIANNQSAFDAFAIHTAYGNDANIATIASSSIFTSTTTWTSFSKLEVDTFSAYGKDTCPPILDFLRSATTTVSAALPIPANESITGLVVKDNYAYLSTDSNISSEPDFFIFDLSNMTQPRMIGSLDTGPGLSGLVIAGPYAYVANKSSANQLQIIDIHNRNHPIPVSEAKVPLDNASSTRPYASAVAYDRGFIYLGTEKGDSPELTIWNVADPAHPILAGRFEIGSIVKSIAVDHDRAFVASAGMNQIMSFDIHDQTRPILLWTSAPPGWATQSGQIIDIFENNISLGRSTGGFNVVTNPEFVGYSRLNGSQISSFDEPGGIYGIIARPPHLLVLTHRSSDELRVENTLGTTSRTYDIPGVPALMACDWGNIYVASNNNPSITAIYDFHE